MTLSELTNKIGQRSSKDVSGLADAGVRSKMLYKINLKLTTQQKWILNEKQKPIKHNKTKNLLNTVKQKQKQKTCNKEQHKMPEKPHNLKCLKELK